MYANTTLRIGQGFDIEIEAKMNFDNALDPITGRGVWIMESDPVVLGPRGRQPLAEKYHDKASVALAEAAVAFASGDEDDDEEG